MILHYLKKFLKVVVAILVGVVVIVFVGVHSFSWYLSRQIRLPEYEEVEVTWHRSEANPELQNWKPDEWQWFYHRSQGSSFQLPLPYPWLLALEQPRLPLLIFPEVSLFVEDDYIGRLGFLPNPVKQFNPQGISLGWTGEYVPADTDPVNNPDGLPVGFTRTNPYVDPVSGETSDVVGFTCAACHTGQLNYQGKGIRIEGGPALTDLGKFRVAIGQSVLYTYYIPTRFRRFAAAVLGDENTPQKREDLSRDLKNFIAQGRNLRDMFL